MLIPPKAIWDQEEKHYKRGMVEVYHIGGIKMILRKLLEVITVYVTFFGI